MRRILPAIALVTTLLSSVAYAADAPSDVLPTPPSGPAYAISYHLSADLPGGDRADYAGQVLTVERQPGDTRLINTRTYRKSVTFVERDFDPFGLVTDMFGPHVERDYGDVSSGLSLVVTPCAAANGEVAVDYNMQYSRLVSLEPYPLGNDEAIDLPVTEQSTFTGQRVVAENREFVFESAQSDADGVQRRVTMTMTVKKLTPDVGEQLAE